MSIVRAQAASASTGMPAGTSAWILASGKVGHDSQSLAVARALDLEPAVRAIKPRRLFAALATYGPIDPRDAPGRPGSALAPPWPDIVFASGRVTLPYLRCLRRESPHTFSVFLQDPRTGAGAADFIWVPAHDPLRGDNVMTTATVPHGFSPTALALARANPDTRLARLRAPRVAVFVGGPSRHYRFTSADVAAVTAIVPALLSAGNSVMVSASRRTPATLSAALRATVATAPDERAFLWDGGGDNPYASMLALAEAIIVTADSVNMVSEALATGAPVHIYEPTGGHAKLRAYLDRLLASGVIRTWAGTLERWPHTPIDATPAIAAAVAQAYRKFRMQRS